MVATIYHEPVLVDAIAHRATGCARVVDGTAGGGGHVAGFVEAGAGVLAIDRDPDAIETLRRRWPQGAVTVIEGSFDDPGLHPVIVGFAPEFVLLDLGVSSHQLDDDDRGFAFRPGVPLDMRMTRSGPTAADVLNTAPVGDLQRMFRHYADERRARPLAQEIDRRRNRAPFATSDDLVNAIRAVLGARSGPSDFARLFQALRIDVNQELVGLERALPALRDALVPGGRMAVIAYHSGEDRIVKHAFREWAKTCVCPPELPVCRCRGTSRGVVETRRPVRPSEEEIAANPRARSAKLRVFRRSPS